MSSPVCFPKKWVATIVYNFYLRGVHLYTSNCFESLAATLVKNLNHGRGRDPLEKTVIVVPGGGVARWLAYRLADRQGIFTACETLTLHGMVQRIFRACGLTVSSGFEREVLVWRIYTLLDDLSGEPDFQRPARYLEGGNDRRKMSFARKTAQLFDRYLAFRPDWLLDWEGRLGETPLPEGVFQRTRVPECEDARWQRCLWQALTAQLEHRQHPAAAVFAALDYLKVSRLEGEDFPEPLSVFGVSSFPPAYLWLLAFLARQRSVHVYLPQPTPDFWGDLMTERQRVRGGSVLAELPELASCPLLASLGKQGQELFNLLIDYDLSATEADERAGFVPPLSEGAFVAGEAPALLKCVQEQIYAVDVHAVTLPEGVDWRADNSLRIHACPSPLREVEVLHDALLDFLNRDTRLELTDIVVMVSDMALYAPLIQAVFDSRHKATDEGEGAVPQLTYSLSDQRVRMASKAVDTFFRMLDLVSSRYTASAVFEILQSPLMREHYGWEDAALDTMRNWLSQTQVCWGIDAAHRTAFDLPEFSENSWREGLAQMFWSFAVGAEEGKVSIEGQASNLLGTLADAFEHLANLHERLFEREYPIREWIELLDTSLLKLYFDSSDDAAYETREIRKALSVLKQVDTDSSAGLDAVLDFLEHYLEEGLVKEGFLRNGITFCALKPMRALPHSVVAVLGLGDGRFPQADSHSGFDLMPQARRIGDRLASRSDRYLFLETLLSAGSKLHLSYSTDAIHGEAEGMPSAVLTELHKHLEAAFDFPADWRQSPVVVQHRLHGHAADYFSGDTRYFTYSREFAQGCQAQWTARRGATQNEPSVVGQFPEIVARTEPLGAGVDAWIRFFTNTSKFYCTQILGIRFPDTVEPLKDLETLELDALAQYKFKDLQVAKSLGFEKANSGVNELAFPPGAWGYHVRREVEQTLHGFLDALKEHGIEASTRKSIHVPRIVLASGVTIESFEIALYKGVYCRFRPSSLKVKDRLAFWIRFLLLCATQPVEQPAKLLGFKSNKLEVVTLAPLSPSAASENLEALAELYVLGQRECVPFFMETAYHYTQAYLKDPEDSETAYNEARQVWLFGAGGYGDHVVAESQDQWHRICWQGRLPENFDTISRAVWEPYGGG